MILTSRRGVEVVEMSGPYTTDLYESFLDTDPRHAANRFGIDVFGDYPTEYAVYLNGAQVAGPYDTLTEAEQAADAVYEYAKWHAR